MTVFETGFIGFLFFQGLLLTLLFFRRRPRTGSILMGILIFRYSLLMLDLLLEASRSFSGVPVFLFLSGPLILLYIRTCRDDRRIRPGEFLFFLPAVLSILPIPVESERMHLFLMGADSFWTLLTGGAALRESVKWRKPVSSGASGTPGTPGIWFVLMPLLVFLSSPVSFLDPLFLLIGRRGVSDFFSLFLSLLEGGMIFIPAWFVLFLGYPSVRRIRGSEQVPQVPGGVPVVKGPAKYEKNLLDPALLDRYYSRLQEGMEKEGWYRQPGLSLNQLSGLLDIPPVHLSQVINRKEKVNFFQYLNRLRVREVCRLLEDTPDRTILEIMYEAGFNSKTTFNSAFRSITGMTPGQYRQSAVSGN